MFSSRPFGRVEPIPWHTRMELRDLAGCRLEGRAEVLLDVLAASPLNVAPDPPGHGAMTAQSNLSWTGPVTFRWAARRASSGHAAPRPLYARASSAQPFRMQVW